MYFIGGMMTCTKNIGHNFISQSEINIKLTIMLYAPYRIIKTRCVDGGDTVCNKDGIVLYSIHSFIEKSS